MIQFPSDNLEKFIEIATCVTNQGTNLPAIDAVCWIINRERDCSLDAAKYIVGKAHSLQEWEALQALLLLENCMKKCGSWFHAEVGKFRFLNELIKLVSPKYLGAHTAESVKRRVIELLADWSLAHPEETKIKEAYDMLKKQGVVQEEHIQPTSERKQQNSIFQDEEKSMLLQKLLRSNNPVDLQAANRLIKSMVKEDERRVEEKWKNAVELETIVNNCHLLKEMLDNYSPDNSSEQEIELIRELHTTCNNLKPVLFKLASNQDPTFCGEVFQANDELAEVLAKYKEIMSTRNNEETQTTPPSQSLLDLTPTTATNASLPNCQVPFSFDLLSSETEPINSQVKSEELDEILCSTSINLNTNTSAAVNLENNVKSVPDNSKHKALAELDLLGETLLKEVLENSSKPIKKNSINKISMNDLMMMNGSSIGGKTGDKNDLSINLNKLSIREGTVKGSRDESDPFDEPLLSLTDTTVIEPSEGEAAKEPLPQSTTSPVNSPPLVDQKDNVDTNQTVLLPLSDIHLSLEDIKPSRIPPYHALEDRGGISLVITLAKDKPREDVSVFVVTTTSTCSFPVSSYLFQPIVPKSCRLRLLNPSGNSLPAHNPFLPPSAITQIMLIASPNKENIILKFVVSYVINEETITEMGEIDNFSLSE